MTILLLALLLAPAAGAVDMEKPGVPADRARAAIQSLPLEARKELRLMYMSYRDEVSRRLDQGWKPGLLSDAVIEDVDAPFQSARLLEEAEDGSRASLEKRQAALAELDPGSPGYFERRRLVQEAKEALALAHRQASREKGICRDWSDDLWSLLTKLDLGHWSVDDRRRAARPFHSAAVACAPQDAPTVCLAFDPWATGEPAVYAEAAWDAKDPGGRLPADYFLHGLPEKGP